MSSIKQIAIIGATASGKTALAIKVAQKYGGMIFSIDSLAVYKEMDIVSAKPTKAEQQCVVHYGIDLLNPDEHFSAAMVAKLYKKASIDASKQNKPLIIVGGSSFYLKSLMTGLSVLPEFSKECLEKAQKMLEELDAVYKLLKEIDPESMASIEPNDRYRLEKLLLIYLHTGEKPSDYFKAHPPQALIKELEIFDIQSDRAKLRERITLRTQQMLDAGLIDEIADLEAKYGRSPASMKAIGVIETLQYLDNEIDKKQLLELISTHTAQLAKRQMTFNKTQFEGTHGGTAEELELMIDAYFLKTDVF